MKRLVIVALMAVVAVMLPSVATAQFNLSKLLGGGSNSSTTTTTANDPYKRLADAAPASSTLNATWVYDTASFSYLGSNALTEMAVAQLNPMINDALRQMGITSGSATLKLNNGTGSITHGDYVMNGTYSYTRSKASIVATTTIDQKSVSVSGYVRYASDTLTVLLDARELVRSMLTVMPELKQDPNMAVVETMLRDLGDVYVMGKFKRK
jgi:hypothetical protein